MEEIVFYCLKCNNTASIETASKGCCFCSCKMFKAARSGIPLMNNPMRDPYRKRNNEEDGYKKNSPGGENEMGDSGLGQRFRSDSPGYNEFSQNSYIPIDGDYNTSDSVMGPETELESPAMKDDLSPFNPMNHSEPLHIGPFNMHKSINPKRNIDDVFNRIQKRRKDNK